MSTNADINTNDRKATISRRTNETDIIISVDLDGGGVSEIQTGIGFFDHMLTAFARHGFIDMTIKAIGDLHVDAHHTVEDVGIVLGKAITDALGDKNGIKRYGHVILPMDEALVLCAVDLSGRAYLACEYNFTAERIGEMDTELVLEFFRAFSTNCPMNLHISVLAGTNAHHIAEAMFKAVGRALSEAISFDPRVKGSLSTKGSLA